MTLEISSNSPSRSAHTPHQKDEGSFFNRITSVVLALIGSAFLASGSYLILSGTGTIPAHTSGIALIIAGATLMVSILSLLVRRL